MAQLLRQYDSDLEQLQRQQKQQVERAELQQESDLRSASKKIRAEQVSVVAAGTENGLKC